MNAPYSSSFRVRSFLLQGLCYTDSKSHSFICEYQCNGTDVVNRTSSMPSSVLCYICIMICSSVWNSVCLQSCSQIITVTPAWNTGETGDINLPHINISHFSREHLPLACQGPYTSLLTTRHFPGMNLANRLNFFQTLNFRAGLQSSSLRSKTQKF